MRHLLNVLQPYSSIHIYVQYKINAIWGKGKRGRGKALIDKGERKR